MQGEILHISVVLNLCKYFTLLWKRLYSRKFMSSWALSICHLSETDWSAKEERCVPDLSRVHLTLGWLLGPLVWLAHQIKHDGYEPVAPETDLELFFTKLTTFSWVEIFNSAQLQNERCQNLLKVSGSASFIPKDTIAWLPLKNLGLHQRKQ